MSYSLTFVISESQGLALFLAISLEINMRCVIQYANQIIGKIMYILSKLAFGYQLVFLALYVALFILLFWKSLTDCNQGASKG